MWEEIEVLRQGYSQLRPLQRAQSSPDWIMTVPTPYPDAHRDCSLLWLICSVGCRVGTGTPPTPPSRLETSGGGKTAPSGNPVFQSPPLLSLPRDPVQTSTGLRNLYNPKTVIIQIHVWPQLPPAPTLMWEKGKEAARESRLRFAFSV